MNYVVLALITMVTFGLHYFFAKVISKEVSSPFIALAGSVVSIPIILGYMYFTGTPVIPDQPVYFWYALGISVPMVVGVITLYMAISKGPVSVVSPLYAMNAMVTAVLGFLILQEPATVPHIAGLFMAVGAIILLSR